MFDIKEYYNYEAYDLAHNIEDIEYDISENIDSLIKNSFDDLYMRDRFKYRDKSIDIIYPKLSYTSNSSMLANPDRIRFLLSFYPCKDDLAKIDKIVLKPAFVEVGNIELVGLYLRRKKILVLYLYHPHLYKVSNTLFENIDVISSENVDKLAHNRLLNNNIKKSEDSFFHIHPLWYILLLINPSDDNKIDKFLIKKEERDSKIYKLLNDISFYYNRHGY